MSTEVKTQTGVGTVTVERVQWLFPFQNGYEMETDNFIFILYLIFRRYLLHSNLQLKTTERKLLLFHLHEWTATYQLLSFCNLA